MSSPILNITALVKSFGSIRANDQITFQIAPGDVLGLLGHNGAGKTTLVSQIVGLLRPDCGSITVAGIDALAHPGRARELLALQAQTHAPLDGLTPKTAITLAGRIRGMSARAAAQAADQLIDELAIGPWRHRRALPEGGGLSGGIRRLTAFAMAAVAPLPLLILDEPTNDVDAARRSQLWQAVRRRADAGAAVLLVTHNVAEAEQIVDDLVILHHGRVAAAGPIGQIRGQVHGDLRLELTVPPGVMAPELKDIPIPVRRRIQTGRRVLLTIPADCAQPAVSWATAARTSGRLDGYSLSPATLAEAYLSVTTEVDPHLDVETETETGEHTSEKFPATKKAG